METILVRAGFTHKILMAPMLPPCPVTPKAPVNIFDQAPEELKKVNSHMLELQNKYQVPLSHLGISYSKSVPKTQENQQDDTPEKEMEFLKHVGLNELIEMAQIYPHYLEEAGEFLFELRDSFIRMIDAIIERNPDMWDTLPPHGFAEREIYDSVIGIMEDDEMEALNLILGGEPDVVTEVIKASIRVFNALETLVCVNTSWKRNIPKFTPAISYVGGKPKLTSVMPWTPFDWEIKKNIPRAPAASKELWELLYGTPYFQLARIASKHIVTKN